MADKFLGTGGRYVDDNAGGSGLSSAKAVRVNEGGRLETLYSASRQVFEPRSLNGGEIAETGILNAEDYTFAYLDLIVSNYRRIRVSIQYYRDQDEGMGYESIYESDGTSSMHHIEYRLRSGRYSLKVENISGGGGYLSYYNKETRFVNTLPEVQKVELTNTKTFKEVEIPFNNLAAGQSATADISAPLGKMWDVKFMTVRVDGDNGGYVALTWRLGSPDVYNDFVKITSKPGGEPSIYLRASGLVRGVVERPYQYTDSKIPQLWEHLNSVAFIGYDKPSRFILENNSNANVIQPIVRLYVVEEG